MKSLSAIADRIPKKSFSSIRSVRQITPRFAPSGIILEKKGNSVSDSKEFSRLGKVAEIGGKPDEIYSTSYLNV